MPTSKPRYMLTDTGELSDLLDAAQRHWPELTDRKALLLRLAEAGAGAIATQAAKQRTAIENTAGVLTGLYEPGELERLRKDWPE
jgi:sulfite reductase beta subunit-like hemoprotein